jgi:hypothetical protein
MAPALDDLVMRIEAEDGAVGAALQSALGHAIAAGMMLIEAKRQVAHGEWQPWLTANCSVPARTARHYMGLALRRKRLCDQNGNVLPISVHEAVDRLKRLSGNPEFFVGPHDPEEMEEFSSQVGHPIRYRWGRQSWGEPFSYSLHAVTRITHCKPPEPRWVVKAAREGKTPGLTAEALREAIALLSRYADALERDAIDKTDETVREAAS